jgi:aspartate 1-decarboxylase
MPDADSVGLSQLDGDPQGRQAPGEPMQRRMMKSKIHRAVVTDANLHYVGSITIDRSLMKAADIRDWEQVQIVDIDNGARFETYAIPGDDGQMCLNGAAARLVQPGDRVIVITYADYSNDELDDYEPTVVHVDTANRPVDEATARRIAGKPDEGPLRYVEIEAEVDRHMAGLDAELGGLG